MRLTAFGEAMQRAVSRAVAGEYVVKLRLYTHTAGSRGKPSDVSLQQETDISADSVCSRGTVSVGAMGIEEVDFTIQTTSEAWPAVRADRNKVRIAIRRKADVSSAFTEYAVTRDEPGVTGRAFRLFCKEVRP